MPVHVRPCDGAEVSGGMDAHGCLELYQGIVGKHAKGLGNTMGVELCCGRACAFRYEISLEGGHCGSCVPEL